MAADPGRARRTERNERADRPRRSHAERTAETRARIITAVVECIAELGLQGTTATQVARRAGVTWGAVQHHFGGKSGMLVAVLDESFARFRREIDEVPSSEGGDLGERVSRFVDAAWRHFSSAHYRSIFEILLHTESDPADEGVAEWRARTQAEWREIWERLFAGSRLSRRRRVVVQHYAMAVLSGLATTPLLHRELESIRPAELELLKQTLRRELTPTS